MMYDLVGKIVAVREDLTPLWNQAHSDRLLQSICRLRRRRSYLLTVGGALAAVFAVVLAFGRQSLPNGGSPHESARKLPDSVQETREAASDPLEASRMCETGDDEMAAQRPAQGDAEVANDPVALMAAADVARFSHRPQASVGYLCRVLREHAQSPVAALAGVTLGRVLLEQLGQPVEAAEAFALARTLQSTGALAQDALAREVEALSKAGQSYEAFLRAQLYIQLYPSGPRLRAVKLFGGLE
ncbi:MAG: hypothetical protein RL701_3631 [Pseudomonadota bacterium]